jgi:L-serine/L-threonine ammonia-lyase
LILKIGHKCQLEAKRGKKMLISSSGGNAGYAVAYAGRKLGLPVIVFVPSSTIEVMIRKIESEGARVIVSGRYWDEANEAALKLLAQHPEASYIPPFDHPEIWQGNSTLVDEIKDQIEGKPDAVICSVGGGGMMNGIVLGLQRGFFFLSSFLLFFFFRCPVLFLVTSNSLICLIW